MKVSKQRAFLAFAISIAFWMSGGLAGAQAPVLSILAKPRIAATPATGSTLELKGSDKLASIAARDYGALSASQPLQEMLLVLSPGDDQKTALQEYLADLQNPLSANFHRWLSPSGYAQHFGVAQEDIAAVTGWLTSNGFTIDAVSAGRTVITFSGTHAQLVQAFHTELHEYQMGDRRIIANDANPRIPTAFAGVVTGLVGLNNVHTVAAHRDAGVFSLDRESGAVSLAASASGATGAPGTSVPQYTTSDKYYAFTPTDFATVYNLNALWSKGIDGTGQNIAIVGRSQINVNDVNYFRSLFGITAPVNLTTTVAGATDPGQAADEGEQALDVEWASSIAKNAAIDLVVGASTATADGLDLAINYAVNNNTAPILNVSYGGCELAFGAAGNAFYDAMWQQAAAQGITVLVATGDSATATCDRGSAVASYGNQVNALASSPNVTAVGGTDFYGTYLSRSTYWGTNSSTNGSALSYIPESPWDDSCANPLVWQALVKAGYSSSSPEAACNNTSITKATGTLNLGGAGGGVSTYYSRPAWQSGFPGTFSSTMRNLPDVSLFAADGLFRNFLVYCQSDALATNSCSLGPSSSNLQAAGGTSFASPSFAAVVALIGQQTGVQQGNINPVLYALGAKQYTGGTSCSATTVIPPASCIFHDVDQGANSVACVKGTTDCVPAITGDAYGIIGYNAGPGYDQASGLGSVDVSNLVNSWSAAASSFAATTVAIQLTGPASTTYGAGIAGTVAVTGGGSTPSGNVAIMSDSGVPYFAEVELDPLNGGKATLNLAQLPVGSYNISANYSGDATHLRSVSAKMAVVIAKFTPALAAKLTRTTVNVGQSSQMSISITGTSSGLPPTGTVTVVNSTSGITIGTVGLIAGSGVNATASLSLQPQTLLSGNNRITLTYSGDANYSATSTPITVLYNGPIGIAAASPALTVNTQVATSAATSVTVSAANGGTPAWPVALTCGNALPAGASCLLGSNVLTAASPSTTVTLQYSPVNGGRPQLKAMGVGLSRPRIPALLAGFFGFGLLVMRRRGRSLPKGLIVGLAATGTLLLSACSGGSNSKSTASIALTTSVAAPSFGSPVVFASQVSGSKGSPTGSVSYQDTFNGATYTLNSAALSAGSASWQTASLNIGTHTFAALYSGDATYQAATSAPVAVDVTSISTLNVTATDANGNAASVLITATIQ